MPFPQNSRESDKDRRLRRRRRRSSLPHLLTGRARLQVIFYRKDVNFPYCESKIFPWLKSPPTDEELDEDEASRGNLELLALEASAMNKERRRPNGVLSKEEDFRKVILSPTGIGKNICAGPTFLESS